jgi:undecaprenyl-diphosphatase UppP
MNLLHAIVLGIVQGLTEFLPISSSGHLLIIPKALGWKDPGAAFTAIIQLGTMLAIVISFRRDIAQVGGGWIASLFNRDRRGTQEARLGWVIVVGTIPISLAGLALRHVIEHQARNVMLVAIALIVGGLIMEWCDRTTKEDRQLEGTRVRDGWIIGLAQMLALIPGVSRSGSTISAARVLRARRRGPCLVPAIDSGRRLEWPARAQGATRSSHRSRPRARCDGRVIRGRLRLDRVPAPLPRVAPAHELRGLPRDRGFGHPRRPRRSLRAGS